jgi:3-oxoacyl-[acyl-carrier protein] reductase
MVVTGSRTGLGLALADHFAGCGYQVLGCSRRPPEGAYAFEYVRADVRDEADVRALFARAREHGGVDVLINNAGVATANYALLTPASVVRESLETMVLGAFLCCREATKLMRRRGGCIVTISSVHVPLATVGTSVYGAAKSAVEQFTRVFAKEVAPYGVRANCLELPIVDGVGMANHLSATALVELEARLARPRVDVGAVVEALAPLIALEPNGLSGATVQVGGA